MDFQCTQYKSLVFKWVQTLPCQIFERILLDIDILMLFYFEFWCSEYSIKSKFLHCSYHPIDWVTSVTPHGMCDDQLMVQHRKKYFYVIPVTLSLIKTLQSLVHSLLSTADTYLEILWSSFVFISEKRLSVLVPDPNFVANSLNSV